MMKSLDPAALAWSDRNAQTFSRVDLLDSWSSLRFMPSDILARLLMRFLTSLLWNSQDELQTFAALPTSRYMTSVGIVDTMLMSRTSDVQA